MKYFLFLAALLCSCSASPKRDSYFPEEIGNSWNEVGRSVENRPIYAMEFGSGPNPTMIFAGFHGQEKMAIQIAFALCHEMRWHPNLPVVIVPILNPDGYVANRRTNSRNVDLNRNFPSANWGQGKVKSGTAPLSEPETRVVMDLVERYRPSKILSLHDPLRVNNYDGAQSEELARAMAKFNGYPISDSIGYPTPGSFGTWAGIEQGIPMVTLEIPNNEYVTRWRENKWALLAAIRFVVDKSTRE